LKKDLNARRCYRWRKLLPRAIANGDYTITKIPGHACRVQWDRKMSNGFRGICSGRVYVDIAVPRCILFLTFQGRLHVRVSTKDKMKVKDITSNYIFFCSINYLLSTTYKKNLPRKELIAVLNASNKNIMFIHICNGCTLEMYKHNLLKR